MHPPGDVYVVLVGAGYRITHHFTQRKKNMLGIEWLTRNEARWNFLDGTIMIRNPEFTLGEEKPPPAQTCQELADRSFYTQRNDCTR